MCGPVRHAQPLVLQRVRVLELVDEQVREAALVVLAQAVVAGEQLVAAQQQLREVDHAFALAHRVVERVVLDLPARELVARLDHVRPQALLLGVGDEPLQLARRKAVVVDVVRAVHALDERQLVLRVEDLEELRQVRLAVMRAQHPVAQAVERADPHAARVDGRERGQPQQHLARGLVGERHREDRSAGRAWPVASSHAMRVVSTRVLPLPAPARISADACGSVTAASCSGFRFSRSGDDMRATGET